MINSKIQKKLGDWVLEGRRTVDIELCSQEGRGVLGISFVFYDYDLSIGATTFIDNEDVNIPNLANIAMEAKQVEVLKLRMKIESLEEARKEK